MGNIDGNDGLAIAEIIFWVPAGLLTLIICYRHGFNRQLGWILVALLAACRIAGSACALAASQKSTPDTGLLIAAGVLGSIGLSFLIQALVGLITRVHENMRESARISPRALRLLQILLLVGLILGSIGSGNQNTADDVSDLSRASIILYAVGVALLGLTVVFTLLRLSHVATGERCLVFACLACYPFLVVRLLYSILTTFLHNHVFNVYSPNVWARAFAQILMEFILAIIIIAAGFITDVVPRDKRTQRQGENPSIHKVPAIEERQ